MKNSTIIGLKELRENTEKYIDKVQGGRSFVVVRRSEPIFKIAPVDIWGDEGMWETVADFREIDEKGIPINRMLKSLRKLNGQNK